MKIRTFGLAETEEELVKLLVQECESTHDIWGKLKQLFARTIEQMLEAEMEGTWYTRSTVVKNNSGL